MIDMSLAKGIVTTYPDIKNIEEKLKAWALAYPSIDIEAEFRKAHAWELSNNKKKNHSRFLTNWFASAEKQGKKAGRRGLSTEDIWGSSETR